MVIVGREVVVGDVDRLEYWIGMKEKKRPKKFATID